MEVSRKVKVRFRFEFYIVLGIVCALNKMLSTILQLPFKPFSHIISQSFFIGVDAEDKVFMQKLRTAIKEAPVVKRAN